MVRRNEGANLSAILRRVRIRCAPFEDRLACVMEPVIDRYADGMFVGHAYKNLDTGSNRFKSL